MNKGFFSINYSIKAEKNKELFCFFTEKGGLSMSAQTKKTCVRILCGVLAVLLLLGCVAILASV